jgi:hypothetical protein
MIEKVSYQCIYYYPLRSPGSLKIDKVILFHNK